jgi:hypothetical protein
MSNNIIFCYGYMDYDKKRFACFYQLTSMNIELNVDNLVLN